MSDINFPILFFQILNIALIILWAVLALYALRALGRRAVSEPVRLGWTILILFVPVLGAAAFLIVHPKPSKPTT